MNIQDIIIRPARADDLSQILTIEEESFSDSWSQQDFANSINHPNAFFSVAAVGDVICGYSVIYYAAGEAEVANIAVSPAHRQSGIGSLLLALAFSALRQVGTETVFLEVRQNNMAAQSLYKKFKFETISIRKNFYREPTEDALLMKCEI